MSRVNLVRQGATFSLLLFIALMSSRPVFLSLKGSGTLSSGLQVTPDGFDLHAQGLAMTSRLDSKLPVLRDPMYVLVSSLNSEVQISALVFGLANSIGLALQVMALFIVLRHLGASALEMSSAGAAYSVLPLHVFSKFVLSDSLAVGLAMFSTSLFVVSLLASSDLRHRAVWFALASIVSIAGAITQLYALAPVLFFSTLVIIEVVFIRRSKALASFFLIGVSSVAIYLWLITAWRQAIPHESTPDQLGLLSFNLDMGTFYLETWGLLIFPIFLTFVILRGLSYPVSASNDSPSVLLIPFRADSVLFLFGLAFMGITFFYQWPDARFTYMPASLLTFSLFAFFVIHRSNISERAKGLALAAFGPLLFSWLIFTPTSFWQPSYQNISFAQPWVLREQEPLPKYEQARLLTLESCLDKTEADFSNLPFDSYEIQIATFKANYCLLGK